jgi:dTDP-4-amino-4,6-dideoxygalactose transaminase
VRTGLAAAGIQTSVHYPPIHTFTQYRSAEQRPLPQTDALAQRILTLPLYGRMTEQQVDAVIEALLTAL